MPDTQLDSLTQVYDAAFDAKTQAHAALDAANSSPVPTVPAYLNAFQAFGNTINPSTTLTDFDANFRPLIS